MPRPLMTYFEVRERLKNLEEFRSLYREYIEFFNREKNPAAKVVRKKMLPLTAMTVDSLKRLDLGSTVTRDAPLRGGKKVRINLIKAIFRDHIIRRYKLDDQTPLEIIDRGIARYRVYLLREKIQLFNPFYWLYLFSEFVARIPFLMARKAGIEIHDADKSNIYGIITIIMQLIIFYLTFEAVGLIDWLGRFFSRIF